MQYLCTRISWQEIKCIQRQAYENEENKVLVVKSFNNHFGIGRNVQPRMTEGKAKSIIFHLWVFAHDHGELGREIVPPCGSFLDKSQIFMRLVLFR